MYAHPFNWGGPSPLTMASNCQSTELAAASSSSLDRSCTERATVLSVRRLQTGWHSSEHAGVSVPMQSRTNSTGVLAMVAIGEGLVNRGDPGTSEPVKDELLKLYRDLASRDKPPNRAWRENLQASGAILVPLVICALGTAVTLRQVEYQNSQAERTTKQQEDADSREDQRQRASVIVAQANMVQGFMEALASSDATKRTLAVKAVVYALPDLGAELAKVVEATDSDTGVRAAAKESVDQGLTTLVSQLSSPDQGTRKSAARSLSTTWRTDPRVVSEISAQLSATPDENGAYNSVVVLNAMDPAVLRSQRTDVEAVAKRAEQVGPKTADQVERLRERVNR
jgi:hypothetical protein